MSTFNELLASLPDPERAALERIRVIVHDVVPEAEEVVSYGMPAFKYQGKYLVGFWAFKKHLSLFPAAAAVDALKGKLTDYKLSPGTIQFTLDHPIPEAIIREMLAIRVASITK